MRVLIQRVSRAFVTVGGDVVGAIGDGFLLLVGITHADAEATAASLAAKVLKLRLFEDDAGHMNRSLLDLLTARADGAAMLVVSQFTLYASTKKGRRPSFTDAAPPAHAEPLIAYFCERLRASGIRVETGRFGAHMEVESVNDGPVTIWLDSEAD